MCCALCVLCVVLRLVVLAHGGNYILFIGKYLLRCTLGRKNLLAKDEVKKCTTAKHFSYGTPLSECRIMTRSLPPLVPGKPNHKTTKR